MSEAIGTGDVVRDRWPRNREDRVNCYVGIGRAGACFDVYGLMNEDGTERNGIGETALTHAQHWHRDPETGMDHHLPVTRLQSADDEPGVPEQYTQRLTLYDGRLETTYTWADCQFDLRSYCHPGEAYRDLLAIEVRHEGALPSLCLSLVDQAEGYGISLTGHGVQTDVVTDPARQINRSRLGTADSAVGLAVQTVFGDAALTATDNGITVDFEGGRGHHLLVLGAASWNRREELADAPAVVRSPEQFAASAVQAWHDRWGDSYVDPPVPEYQAFWARSLYYLLASYAPDVRCPAPPHGWTGNNWGYHFPQDLSYIHPALLRLGHFDIVQSWVEFYRERLATTREWTERVWNAKGTMWEWEFPIGPDPNRPYPNEALSHERFHYQIHNAAYPARMAAETARYLDDPEWTREVAWPIVRGSARFYASIANREDTGRWSLDVEPSMGQDEYGQRDMKTTSARCSASGTRSRRHSSSQPTSIWRIRRMPSNGQRYWTTDSRSTDCSPRTAST